MAIQSYEETPLKYQKNGAIWQCYVFDLPWKIAEFVFSGVILTHPHGQNLFVKDARKFTPEFS